MVDDHALELHAQLHDGREVLDTVKRDLRDMEQPRHATDLHKRSVRLDGLDMTVEMDGRDGGMDEKGTSHIAGVNISSVVHTKTKNKRVLNDASATKIPLLFYVEGRRSACTAV